MQSLRHVIPALLLLPVSIQAVTLDCSHIRDNGQSFNLEKLGGPKTVHYQEWEPPTIKNTTFTLDICAPLKEADAKKNEKCYPGTRVCAKEWLYRDGQDPYLEKVIPIAGQFSLSHGRERSLDPTFTRLKGDASNSDDKEGVIVELNGGKYPDTKKGTPQRAIIEFLCDRKLTGNEGFESSEMHGADKKRADEEEGPELPDLDEGKSLQFISYKDEEDVKVLRLRWKTKYACEDAVSSGGNNGRGWGFFTWLIIILFLAAASYIIFGSWLNYNRYGARGWDLIPHGDTIRDIPYIVKDWGVHMADRLKGQDSRGGYSAV